MVVLVAVVVIGCASHSGCASRSGCSGCTSCSSCSGCGGGCSGVWRTEQGYTGRMSKQASACEFQCNIMLPMRPYLTS